MFRQILQLFKGTDPLREILGTFASMLDDSAWMYDQVLDIYSGRAAAADREELLFARDREINAKEREIRRRLVEYLTITERPDVSSCLILMSVSKDAERIGDYIKNMYDVSVATRSSDRPMGDLDLVAHQLRTRGLPLFESTKRAFMTSDRAMAERALEMAMELSADAEKHVWFVADQTDLSPKDAVAHALSARHLKRIARHLGNIATAVIQPVDWMNYSDEPHPRNADAPPGRRDGDEDE